MRVQQVAVFVVFVMLAASCGGSQSDDAAGGDDSPTPAPTTEPTPAAGGDDSPTPAPTTVSTPTTVPTPPTGDDAPDGEPSPQELLDGLLSRPTASLDVEVSSDATVSAEIGPDGGSLETVDATGTTYTLTVPPNALLAPAAVTMTPVIASGEVIGDETTSGVQLQPSGLNFLRPFTLTVSGPDVPSDGVAWTTADDGSELHLAPATAEGNTVTIVATHFTNWGADSRIFEALATTNGVADNAQANATLVSQAITGGVPGAAAAAVLGLSAVLDRIRLDLQVATTSSSIELLTIELVQALTTLDQLSSVLDPGLVGDLEDTYIRAYEQWVEAVVDVVENLAEVCSNGNADPGLRILRWSIIIGELDAATTDSVRSSSAMGDATEALATAYDACMTFVLTWSPTVTITDPQGRATTSVTAKSEPLRIHSFTFTTVGATGPDLIPGQPVVVGDIDLSFNMPCAFIKTPGVASMGLSIESSVTPHLGHRDDIEISRMTAFVGIDEPIGIECQGEDFGFNFFSAEMEILNISRNGSSGYSMFQLEVVRTPDVFAQISTSDQSTIGSTATLDQTLTVSLAPPAQ